MNLSSPEQYFKGFWHIETWLTNCQISALCIWKRLTFFHEDLNDRRQRVCVNNNFGSWEKIIAGVPQVSILGPFLCNIVDNHLFLFISSSNLINYANGNMTTNACTFNLEEVKICLSTDFDAVTKWFYEIASLLML